MSKTYRSCQKHTDHVKNTPSVSQHDHSIGLHLLGGSLLNGKVHLGTDHESQEGGADVYLYSFFNLPLDGVGGQRHAPSALPPGKTRYPLYGRQDGPQGRSGQR